MKEMKKNKRGWIMIVEAVIAVLILFGFVFAAMSKQTQETKALRIESSLYGVANTLVLKAQENETIRSYVLTGNDAFVNNSLKIELSEIKLKANIDVKIQNLGDVCSSNIKEKEIYTADALISSTTSSNLNLYEPKKLCVFVWQE